MERREGILGSMERGEAGSWCFARWPWVSARRFESYKMVKCKLPEEFSEV